MKLEQKSLENNLTSKQQILKHEVFLTQEGTRGPNRRRRIQGSGQGASFLNDLRMDF